MDYGKKSKGYPGTKKHKGHPEAKSTTSQGSTVFCLRYHKCTWTV